MLKPNYEKNKFNMDWILLGILVLIMIISLTSIYFALPLSTDNNNLVVNQAIWYISGIGLMIFLIKFGKDNLYTAAHIAYWILMAAMVLLLLDYIIPIPFVTPINGSRSWFIIPKFGSFQPSEFMKTVLILITAEIIEKHNRNKNEVSYKNDIELFIEIGKYVLPALMLMFPQPDTGIPLIIIISIIVMISLSGVQRIWVYVGVGTVAIVFFGILFLFYFAPNVLIKIFGSSYRLSRFYGWLETEKYIATYGNQLYKGLLAMGSAGLTGHPFREVVVAFAEPQNDFIFAVIGQNFGFLGATFVILLCTFLDLKILTIALKHESMRDRMLVAGLLGMLVFQQVENMGMITGLLPITGITLPLISYGGSSLWSYMIIFSIIFTMSSENIAKKGYTL